MLKLGEHLRLSPILKGAREPYRYEREVEEFLRWSPSVQGSESPLMRTESRGDRGAAEAAGGHRFDADGRAPGSAEAAEAAGARAGAATRASAPIDDYDELEAEEIIALLGSMERRELEALRELESASRARPSVLHAIDSVLARAPAAG